MISVSNAWRVARNALEEVAGELREIEQARMTSEQKLPPLREAIGQVRLKEQEARITENQFGEHLKESGTHEQELIQTARKNEAFRLAGRDYPAEFGNRRLGSGESRGA